MANAGGVRKVERIKYAVGAACRRPFAASQTRGGCAGAPTHDFVWQALDPYCFASALGRALKVHNLQADKGALLA